MEYRSFIKCINPRTCSAIGINDDKFAGRKAR
jgi:hypothetical protein